MRVRRLLHETTSRLELAALHKAVAGREQQGESDPGVAGTAVGHAGPARG
jgi:hypothetical protein